MSHEVVHSNYVAMKTLEGKPKRKDLPPGDCLCNYCVAKCCRYFALPIDTPTDWQDFDYLRWYLLHARATVFTENDTWYLMVHTLCRHLQPDNRCGIYDTRPQICREYSTEKCEYDDDWTYERYFETPEQIHEYAEAVLPPARGQSIRSRKPQLLPVIH
jgi:Fe-S-cluster containining protein